MSVQPPLTPTNNLLPSIQLLRAIAVSSVVLLHGWVIAGYERNPNTIMHLFEHGGVGVDIFFIVSGFVMSFIRGSYEAGTPGGTIRFLQKRGERIIPPYWIYTTLIFVTITVAPQLNQGPPSDILRSYLLIPSERDFILMVGWTLSYEIYFYILFAATLRLAPDEKRQFILLAGYTGCAVAAGVLLRPENPIAIVLTSSLLLEFIAGMAVGIWFKNRWRRAPEQGLALVVLALGLFWAMHYGALKPEMPFSFNGTLMDEKLPRLLHYGVPSLLLAIGILKVDPRPSLAMNAVVLIGNASYSLYLSHWLVIKTVAVAWRRLPVDMNLAFVAVCFVASTLYAILTYRLVEREAIAWVKRLPGLRWDRLVLKLIRGS